MQGAPEGAGGPQGTLRGGLKGHVFPVPGGHFHPLGDQSAIVFGGVRPISDGKAGPNGRPARNVYRPKPFEIAESQNIVLVFKI